MKHVLFIFILLAVSLPGHAEGVHLYTEKFKPYQYLDENGDVTGFTAKLVVSMFARSKVELADKIRIAVWKEAYKRALSEPNTGIFLTVKTPARESMFKWVGPLAPRTLWLYKLRERKDIQASTLEEAKQYMVGTYQAAQSEYLEELRFPKLDIVLKEELNLKKLLAGRVELIPSLETMMASKLRDLNLPLEHVEKVVVLDQRYDYYLALNKGVPDTTVAMLQAALDEMKQDGTYEALHHQYISQSINAPMNAPAIARSSTKKGTPERQGYAITPQ